MYFVAALAILCLIWSDIVKIGFLFIVHNHPLKEAVLMITRWKLVTLNFGRKIDSSEKYNWKIQHPGDSPGFQGGSETTLISWRLPDDPGGITYMDVLGRNKYIYLIIL